MDVLKTMLLPQDKANHAFWGSVAAMVISQAAAHAGLSADRANVIGFAGTIVIGLLKELSDWIANRVAAKKGLPPPHEVSGYDWLFTALGGLIVSLGA